MSAAEEPFPGSPDDMMNTVAALRARNAKLKAALRSALNFIVDLRALHATVPPPSMLSAAIEEIEEALK